MKTLTLILLLFGFVMNSNAQIVSASEIPALVEMLDKQINLNDYQEKELTSIFTSSSKELERIQSLRKSDIEKLQLLRSNKKTTRAKLEVVLDHNQFQAYKSLLDGGNSNISIKPEIQQATSEEVLIGDAHDDAIPDIFGDGNGPRTNSNGSNTSSNSLDLNLASANSIADKLNFKGSQRAEFVKAYNVQEKTINDIQSSGMLDVTAGINLLTSVLLTDLKVIELGGKSTYENYFNMRSSGQLGLPASSNGKEVNITQVYQLNDLITSLEMSDLQKEKFIRLILDGEANKKSIRSQYQGAERSRRLKELEQNSLKKLQQILSANQIKKLMQMMGG